MNKRFNQSLLSFVAVIFFLSFASSGFAQQYLVINAPGLSWQQARDSAIALGGDLVTITDASEQTTVGALVNSGNWWIGATDAQVEGDWRWVSNEAWGYTNWFPGEPNNAGNEDVAYLNASLGDKWVDGSANESSNGFILEFSQPGPYPLDLRLTDSITSQIVTSLTPTIIWNYAGSALPQTEYQIQVGNDADWTVAEMWDTGPVASSDTAVTYSGTPLQNAHQYYLRVRLNDGVQWGAWRSRAFFVYASDGNSTYQLIHYHASWTNSRDSAIQLGGHLATITSPAEQQAVAALTNNSGIWWIGGTDANNEGNWEWVTDEPFIYTNWFATEPNGGTGENYCALHGPLGNYWADYSNSLTLDGFILEIDLTGPFPKNLRLVDSVNSEVVSNTHPTVMWDYSGSSSPQAAYEIQVGTDNNWQTVEMWDTGPVFSSATSVPYAGAQLTDNQQYYIRVRVNDGTDWGSWKVRSFSVFDLSDGSSYQAIASPGITWREAYNAAHALGGHLVTITNSAEQAYAASLITTGSWWIGATDNHTENTWQWETGDPWQYNHWADGEPDGDTNQNVGSMSHAEADKWTDENENAQLDGYILEIDGNSSTNPYPHDLHIGNTLLGTYCFNPNPFLAWSYTGSPNPQTQYEIQVGTDMNWNTVEMWNSGQVSSADTAIIYAGAALQDHQTYYFRVRLNDGITWGGWITKSFVYVDLSNGSAYFTIKLHGINWHAARDSAETLGGYLATITSQTEQQKVQAVLPNGEWWIGGSDEATEGIWRWVTGETWSYTNWLDGEPNGGFNENFLSMGTDFGGQWIDRQVTYPMQGFVLEIAARKPFAYGLGFLAPYVEPYVGSLTPTIVWLYHNYSGGPQRQYEIEIGSDTNWTTAEMWATGPVVSADTQAVYAGLPMTDGDEYFMRVRVADDSGWGDWSALSFRVFDASAHRYEYISKTMTWQQASDSAQLAGGYLVTLTNPLENALVSTLIPNSNPPFFAGASDSLVEGAWMWVTGEPFIYANWLVNEPSNSGVGEDYMEVRSDFNWKWNDVTGSVLRSFVIEWDQRPRITMILVDGATNNQHVVPDNPLFVWQRNSDTLIQDSAEIEVSSTSNWAAADMWNPPVLHSADSDIVYAGTPLQEGVTYYSRVRASYNGAWTTWTYSRFRMNTKPVLGFINERVEVYGSQTPEILIPSGLDAQNDLLTYIIEGFYDSTLTVRAVLDSSDPSPVGVLASIFVDTPMIDNRIVWWHCRISDGYEYSDWSPIRRLVINTTPQAPLIATLISPPAQPDMPVYDMTPLMVWHSVDPDPYDTILYDLEVAADSNFVFERHFDSLTSEQFEFPDSLGFNKQYWWRVTSYNPDGTSFGPSLSASFWTWTLGDINHSRTVTIQDLTTLVSFLFNNGPAISPQFTADLNHSCTVTIQDLVYLVNYLFNGGPAPKVGCGP